MKNIIDSIEIKIRDIFKYLGISNSGLNMLYEIMHSMNIINTINNRCILIDNIKMKNMYHNLIKKKKTILMKMIGPKSLNESLIDAQTSEETEKLLSYGAKIYPDEYYRKNFCRYKWTALMAAKNPEQTELLLKSSELDDRGKKDYVNDTSIGGHTALMFSNSVEQTRLLIEAGAKINIKNNNDGWTALMHSKNTDQTRLLLKDGADVNLKNFKRETALMIASSNKSTHERVEILLEAGATVNDQSDGGLTALICASTPEKTEILLKAGADVHSRDMNGMTALMYSRSAKQTKLLIEAGAKVNLQNNKGETALSLSKIPEQQQILIEAGAIPFNTYLNNLKLFWINLW